MTKLISGCFLIIFFIGCKDMSTDSSHRNELFPLRVGNYWRYRSFSYDSVGNKNDNGVYLSETIVRDTLIDGNRWSIMSVRSFFSGETPYINKADGLYYRGENIDYLRYKYPANIGDIFGDSIIVVGVNQKVSSIVGDVNCLVYKKERFDPTILWVYYTTYVAPGFGEVKIEYYQSNDRVVWKLIGELSLDSCNINRTTP